MGKVVGYYCDIEGCGESVKPEAVREYDVVFETEQNEGRSTEPYFSADELYLCDEHTKEVLRLTPIKVTGAMGFNKYRIMNNQPKKGSQL